MEILYQEPAFSKSNFGVKKMTGIIPEKMLFGSNEIYSHHSFLKIDLSKLRYKPKITSHFGGLTHVWGGNLSLISEADTRIAPDLIDLKKYDEKLYEYFNASGYMSVGRSSKIARLDQRKSYLFNTAAEKRLKKKMQEQADDKFRVYFSNLAINSRQEGGGCIYCGECLTGCRTQSIWAAGIELKALSKKFNFTLTEGARVTSLKQQSDGILVSYSEGDTSHQKLYSRVLIGAGVLDSIDILANSGLVEDGSTISDSRKYYTIFYMPKKADKRYEKNGIALSNITYQYDTKWGTIHSQIYPSIDILERIFWNIPLPKMLKNYLKSHLSIGMVYLPEGLSESVKINNSDGVFMLHQGSLSVGLKIQRMVIIFKHYCSSFIGLIKYGYFKFPVYHKVPLLNSQHYGNLRNNASKHINKSLPKEIIAVDSSALNFITGIPTTLLIAANAKSIIDERF